MRAPSRRAWIVLALVLVSTASAGPLDEADARIEKYRKADVVVEVKADGRPAAGATVAIHQERHAFLFGANIFFLDPNGAGEAQKGYQDRFAALLNYATLPFYWGAYEPVRGVTGEARLRGMAEWCRDHGIAVKGHPVVWHSVFPGWVRADEPMEPLLKKRIDETVGRFKGLVDRWDVVNESLAAPQFKNAYGAWMKEVGPLGAVDKCLRWAAEANADGFFLVNDYKVSPEYAKELSDLRDAKAPFRAIGIQSHMHGGEWPLERVWEVCEEYAKLGKPIDFTEVTVLSGPKEKDMKDWETRRPQWDTTPDEEARQADYVEKLYTVLFSHPSVEAITWWDLSDAASWMGAPAGLLRKDMSPKPVYDRLLAKVKGAWWTKSAEAKTDADGRATLRGFLGAYSIEAKLPDGRTKKATFDLKKGDTPQTVEVEF